MCNKDHISPKRSCQMPAHFFPFAIVRDNSDETCKSLQSKIVDERSLMTTEGLKRWLNARPTGPKWRGSLGYVGQPGTICRVVLEVDRATGSTYLWAFKSCAIVHSLCQSRPGIQGRINSSTLLAASFSSQKQEFQVTWFPHPDLQSANRAPSRHAQKLPAWDRKKIRSPEAKMKDIDFFKIRCVSMTGHD